MTDSAMRIRACRCQGYAVSIDEGRGGPYFAISIRAFYRRIMEPLE
jgi:hypothetical protein